MISVIPAPNDAPVLASGVYIFAAEDGALSLFNDLAELLVDARERYEWPLGAGPRESQRRVIDLEKFVQSCLGDLKPETAWLIVRDVAEWGGNNRKAIDAVRNMSQAQKQECAGCIGALFDPSHAKPALRGLTAQPGIDRVMASKIYRFCVQQIGAAVDRHSSYFFNSLRDLRVADEPRSSSRFRREWSDGKHKASRLAVYYDSAREFNLEQYFGSYLPLMGQIADRLNGSFREFKCAVSGQRTPWRAADVEMAAYQWWSRNGPR